MKPFTLTAIFATIFIALFIACSGSTGTQLTPPITTQSLDFGSSQMTEDPVTAAPVPTLTDSPTPQPSVSPSPTPTDTTYPDCPDLSCWDELPAAR